MDHIALLTYGARRRVAADVEPTGTPGKPTLDARARLGQSGSVRRPKIGRAAALSQFYGVKVLTETDQKEAPLKLVGYVDRLSRLSAQGWAADLDDPENPVRISVYVNGSERTRVLASEFRPDVERVYGSGKHGFVHRFLPPLPFDQEFSIKVVYAQTQQLIPNGERKLEAYSSATLGQIAAGVRGDRPLIPIYVTALPRSGTTLLMSKLNAHPNISVADIYPFELKLATYCGNAMRVLTHPGDHVRSMHQNDLNRDYFRIGFNPYYHDDFLAYLKREDLMDYFFQSLASTNLRNAFRDELDAFYRLNALAQDKKIPSHFAEKLDPVEITRPHVLSFFSEYREILLLRDPRDVFCSQRAYPGILPKSAAEFILEATEFYKIVQSKGPNSMWVRYEDLITDQTSSQTSIWDFLGLEETSSQSEGDGASFFPIHATSASPEQSIGRWKKELSKADQEAFAKKFDRFLQIFDYEA